MKNFYNSNPLLLMTPSAPIAFKSMYGRILKQTMLLVLSMLLLSLNSFGQGTNLVYQFTSTQSGKWEVPATWGKTASGTPVAGTHYPSPTDDVKIMNGHIVTIESGEYSCKNLTLVGGGGNPKEGGQLILGDFDDQTITAVAKLNLANLKFSIANGKPKERATLRMGYNGYLTVSESIYKISITGNGKDESLTNSTTNSDIFYSFRRASTIEYRGSTQSIFNFNVISVTDNNVTETSTTYGNLILSGSGVKTPVAGLEVRSNLSVTSGATFEASTFTHTISGNWTNSGTLNSITSTVILNGTSKSITSTGTGAFNNLTVSNGTSSMTTNIIVNKELRVESTVLETGTSTLFLGSTANLMSLETATAHIRGNVQTTRNLITPTGELFGNIGIRITDFPSDINAVTVKRVTGTAFVSANSNSSVLRQFHLTTPGATATNVFNATIDMRFPDYELGAPVGTASYDIFRQNLDNSIENLPKTETADPTYNYKLAKADRKYGRYTLANRITPLPVELTWFKAQRQAQGVLLTWETASEKENKGFEVQASKDGKSFSKIAFVESRVVNSSVTQRYSYIDKAPVVAGTRYYRLAQVDLDGTTTYSSLKIVDMSTKIVAAAAFPNPFAEGQEVSVRLPQGGESRLVNIVLTNTLGQVVYEQQAQVQDGEVELSVNTAKANAKGLYLLNVIDNGTKYTFKLVKK